MKSNEKAGLPGGNHTYILDDSRLKERIFDSSRLSSEGTGGDVGGVGGLISAPRTAAGTKENVQQLKQQPRKTSYKTKTREGEEIQNDGD